MWWLKLQVTTVTVDFCFIESSEKSLRSRQDPVSGKLFWHNTSWQTCQLQMNLWLIKVTAYMQSWAKVDWAPHLSPGWTCFLVGTCTAIDTYWHWHRNSWHHHLPERLLIAADDIITDLCCYLLSENADIDLLKVQQPFFGHVTFRFII